VESVPPDVTSLLRKLADGNQEAASELIPVIYRELHRLAAGHLRHERQNHTLQATALVHEAYLKLIAQRNTDWKNRAHFFAVASSLMRRILVDYARRQLRAKRGARQTRLSLAGMERPAVADRDPEHRARTDCQQRSKLCSVAANPGSGSLGFDRRCICYWERRGFQEGT
jgi:RNA polymerase sigma factor (TIGR02999 family)